jgi:bud emergence protein 1
VIAQSNPEWFVAKPIGRLGGPGLIPVSFVEIRDMTTDTAVSNAQDAIKRAGVPKVEEWKKMAADYKNSSITLGKFEGGGPPGQQQPLEQGMERLSLQQQRNRQSQQQNLVGEFLISVQILDCFKANVRFSSATCWWLTTATAQHVAAKSHGP